MSVPEKKAVPGAVLVIPPRSPPAGPRRAEATFQATGALGTGGIVGSVLSRLGYVPKAASAALTSEVATLQAQISQMNSQNNALSARAGTVEALFPQIQGRTDSLVGQEPGLIAQYAQVETQVGTLQAEVVQLENEEYALKEDIADLNGQIDSENQTIVQDRQTVAQLSAQVGTIAPSLQTLQGQVTSLQGQIAAFANGITGVAAGPALTGRSDPYTQAVQANGGPTVQDPDWGQLPLLGNDADPALGGNVDAYYPADLSFAANYAGLTTSGGPNLMDARRSPFRTQATGPPFAPGSILAGLLGYMPSSGAASVEAQIASLKSQLSAALSLNQLLQVRLGNDASALEALATVLGLVQGAVSGITALVAAGQAQASALVAQIEGIEADISQEESVVASLQGQLQNLQQQDGVLQQAIASLQTQIQNAASAVASLQSQIQGLAAELAAWRAGGFPVTYSWSWGDGGSDSVANPTHAYSAYGGFTPSLTVSVSTPDGNVWSRTFTWHRYLLGKWPSSNQTWQGAQTLFGGTDYAAFFDPDGAPIAGLKVLWVARSTTGVVGQGGPTNPAVTDSKGTVDYNYSTFGTIRWVPLRNPLANAKQGLETFG